MLLQLVEALQGALRTTAVIYALTALVVALSIFITTIIQTGDISVTRRKLKNLRKYGVSTTNMADQYDPKFRLPEDSTANEPIRIKSLYIHPVKSCGYIEVDRALLTKTGFLYDRCFALAVEESPNSWRFISQRTKPTMCLISTELWLPHDTSSAHDPLVQAGGCVVLSFPDPDVPGWTSWLETLFYTWTPSAKPEVSVVVPLEPTASQTDSWNIKIRPFGIHGREAKGLDMGAIPSIADALPKLKRFLRIPEKQNFTLLRCTPKTLTRTDRNLAPLQYIGSPSVHGYTDQQPVNINNISSVQAVSELLPPENQPLNALRFRANIWVTGAPAYSEETWKRYRILPNRDTTEPRADVAPVLSVVCRTSRCTMPNVNPDTGVFDADIPAPDKKKGKPQPSTTLIEYRTPETGNAKALGYLGMHCVPEDRSLEEAKKQERGLYVEVGDEIEVLERGVHLYGSTANDY